MDPTRKKYLPTTTPAPPIPIPYSTLNYGIARTNKTHNHPKRVSSNYKVIPPSDPPLVHTHLHPKSLTLSLDAANNSSLNNKTHFHPQPNISKQKTTRETNMVKQRKTSQKLAEKIKSELILEGGGGRGERNRLIEVPKRPSVSNSLLIGGGGGGGDERRRRRRSSSFCCNSEIELSEFLSSIAARIVAADMPPFMQTHAVSCARKAYDSLDKLFSPKTLASTLKKEFDGVYGPAWHCIVGTSFGTFVTHSVGGFLYFSLDHPHHNKLYFLLFKTTVLTSDN